MRDDLITKAQLAVELNVSTQTVSKWVKLGVLPPPIKLGNRAYWRRAEIQKAVERAEALSR